MSLTDRDRKLVIILVPVVLFVGYWFLALSPQRAEVSKLDSELTTVQGERDDAVTNAQQLERSRTSYAKDYATVVRLGKAIPSTLDMPSLIVQMESAAKGSGVDFDNITVGPRTSAATGTSTSSGTNTSGGSRPVDAGGEKGQTGGGKATEKANDASKTSDSTNQAAGADSSSTSSSSGTATTSGVAGLDTVPLNFDFTGSYSDLADFFHRVKRFVRVANSDIKVKGRLMTIDTMSFKSEKFPSVTATVTATVYLAPKTEGATGGATSQGPGTATPASSTTTPPSSSSTPAPSPSGENPQ